MAASSQQDKMKLFSDFTKDGKLRITVFPNPEVNNFTIWVSQPSRLTIMDLSGKSVFVSEVK